ncbi:MAG: hypothetical protein IAE91_07240 [Ignavibacteriaceae bacterium]|nr:hypothetical protein [Ignavibacteriaceae bacterium]
MFKPILLLFLFTFLELNSQTLWQNWYLETSHIDFVNSSIAHRDIIKQLNSRIAAAGYSGVDVSLSSYSNDDLKQNNGPNPFVRIIYDSQGREIMREYAGGENNSAVIYINNYDRNGNLESYYHYDGISLDRPTVLLDYVYENDKIKGVKYLNKDNSTLIKESEFAYNENGKLVYAWDSFRENLPNIYEYDENGRFKSFREYGITFFNIEYDKLGRETKFNYSGGSGIHTFSEELFYIGDETYPIKLVSYRKGTVQFQENTAEYFYEYKYDNFGNLTEIRYCEKVKSENGEDVKEDCKLYTFNYRK